MDLVDIDEVLNNLERCEEEEANRLQKKVLTAAAVVAGERFLNKTSNGCVILPPTPPSSYKRSIADDNLDINNSEQINTSDDDISLHSKVSESGFQPLRSFNLIANSKRELIEYADELEASKDLQKFTEKSTSKYGSNLLAEQSDSFVNASTSSESLTTSSPSTFSSGPSLGDSSIEETPLQNDDKQQLELAVEAAASAANGAEHLQCEDVEEVTESLSSISINKMQHSKESVLSEICAAATTSNAALEKVSKASNTAINPHPHTSDTKPKILSNSDVVDNYSNVIACPPVPTIQVSSEAPQKASLQDEMQQRVESVKIQMLTTAAQPVKFCSTMEDISDAELDSMLQEMDIDDELKDSRTQKSYDVNCVSELAGEQHNVVNNLQMPQTQNAILVDDNHCDHPNGDSFSQASTVEFCELKATAYYSNAVNDVNTDSSEQYNEVNSGLENDIILTNKIDDEPIDEQLQNDMYNDYTRPQRPTTLDLPALQSLDLMSNAGQTPPGNEQIGDELHSSQSPSSDEHPELSVQQQIALANNIAEQRVNEGSNNDANTTIGRVPPIWVPDNMAVSCMQCSVKFTMIKRRHHCRACGKVLCSVCCSQKFKLNFIAETESRVCVQCYLILMQRQDKSEPQTGDNMNADISDDAGTSTSAAIRSPNPNNPMEYCSTIPPHRQVSSEPKTPPTVIVPVGVLKKDHNGSYSSTSSSSSTQKARKRKSVMFSDGIAPGSDLASIDQWNEPKQARRQNDRSHRNAGLHNKPPTPARTDHTNDNTALGLVAQLFRGALPSAAAAALSATSTGATQAAIGAESAKSVVKSIFGGSSSNSTSNTKSNSNSNNDSAKSTNSGVVVKTQETKSRAKHLLPSSGCDDDGCFIPAKRNSLPPIVIENKENGCDFIYKDVVNNKELVQRLQQETLKFVVQKNFFIFVKIVNLKCCLNRTVINFTTYGMHAVGNDEIVILLEMKSKSDDDDADDDEIVDDDDLLIPRDIFVHLNEIYNDAERGNTISELSYTCPQNNTNFLSSVNYGGFVYIRATFQCMLDVIVPDNPYLIGILIHRYEIPWAKIFPLRLVLRLGAQYRYYPCPHISMRQRDSVYGEIAHTIINFLADFQNYTYTLPLISGMYIHMEDRHTTVLIPRNRLEDINNALNDASDHIVAFGGNFSKVADGHLVCIQNINDTSSELYSYSTQAINIQGHPRKVTGGSFLVLNESLKNSSGFSAKCCVVEDGLVVQITPTKMEEIRNALKNQIDIDIVCGPIDAVEQQTETVCLKWVDGEKDINLGVKSPIDGSSLEGISSMRVHASFNYSNNNYTIRLTEIYVHKCNVSTSEITRITEQLARSTSMALVPLLDLLVTNRNYKIGLRATLHQDNVGYEAGTGGNKLPPLYMNALDDHLIATLHGISANIEDTIMLELVFHILNA